MFKSRVVQNCRQANTKWLSYNVIHSLFVAVTDIKAGGYLPLSTCITRTQTSNSTILTDLTDRNNATCLHVKQSPNDSLQAVFQFPNLSSSLDMSVEVVVRNVEDCSSVTWNWFVESMCAPKNFLECQKSILSQQLNYSRCIVLCPCNPTCDYLYLKYTPTIYEDQSGEEICDVYLVNPYRIVIPEARGILPISSATVQT